jgi:hypothetical protein
MENGEFNYIVAAFYTEQTPYAMEIEEKLLKSLRKLSIPYYVEKIENKGNWRLNTAYKPQLALNAMEKYPDKDIVLLDADSVVTRNPILFNEIPKEYDVALHILDWDTWYRNGEHVKEVLSGTMLLRNNEKTKALAKEWLDLSANAKMWEQRVLEDILKRKPDIKVYNLPLEYCYINSMPNGKLPFIRCPEAVIIHYQASRKFRTLVSRLISQKTTQG